MVYLANVEENRMVSVAQIAETLGVSRDHLGKVLQRLNKLGLATSHKGPGGGFSLQRWQRDTTLLEIVEAIDGPLSESCCLLQSQVCSKGHCILGGLLDGVHREVHGYLSSRKLSGMSKTFPASLTAEAAAR
jgi:Rrf2 family protein